MATDNNHFVFNPSVPSGNRLRAGLTSLEGGREILTKELATMTADLTGDGSNIAHFDKVASRYGFNSTDDARAAWLELSSALAKVTGDGSVSNTDAALRQLFTRLR